MSGGRSEQPEEAEVRKHTKIIFYMRMFKTYKVFLCLLVLLNSLVYILYLL